jgi:hypothetical protein
MQLSQAVLSLFECPIRDILAALPDELSPVWEQARFRQNQFISHDATRSIVFRWPAPGWRPGVRAVVLKSTYPSPGLVEAIDHCADTIAAKLRGEAIRVMLAELPPGAVIKPHRDTDDRAHVHRCHLPVVTNEHALLVVDNRPHHLLAGTVYEFDNTRVHGAQNGGATPRVHLLCDIASPD